MPDGPEDGQAPIIQLVVSISFTVAKVCPLSVETDAQISLKSLSLFLKNKTCLSPLVIIFAGQQSQASPGAGPVAFTALV